MSCYFMQRHCQSFTLFVDRTRFLWRKKGFILIMNFWEMLYILLLHIVKEMRHGIRGVCHVLMCLKPIWFYVCIPLWVLKVFKIKSIWFCDHQILLTLHISNFVKKDEKYKSINQSINKHFCFHWKNDWISQRRIIPNFRRIHF